jgi:hypothetical protein
MDTNQIIKFGLLGAGALVVGSPKIRAQIFGGEQEESSSTGGGFGWGTGAFAGNPEGTSKGAVAGSESGSKKTSQSGETSFQTITITQEKAPIEPNLVEYPTAQTQTKKEIATSTDNYDYVGRSPDSKYSYNPSSPSPVQNSPATQKLINSINESSSKWVASLKPSTNPVVISVAPKKTFIQKSTGAIGSFFGGLFK